MKPIDQEEYRKFNNSSSGYISKINQNQSFELNGTSSTYYGDLLTYSDNGQGIGGGDYTDGNAAGLLRIRFGDGADPKVGNFLTCRTTVDKKQYGFEIYDSESNPNSMVRYIEDNSRFAPMSMNNGEVDLGDWDLDDFFMPRPCALKSDGAVDYYLDKNNCGLREDGETPSDIADTTYDGNFMMEFGRDNQKIWLDINSINIGGDVNVRKTTVKISNYKTDSPTCKCLAFIDDSGHTKKHFYLPIYEGSLVNGKLRSLSGRSVSVSRTLAQDRTAAQANGTGWDVSANYRWMLAKLISILLFKNVNLTSTIGQGSVNGTALQTGTMNTKGMFYGTQNGNDGVKVLGIENFYGNYYKKVLGQYGLLTYIRNNSTNSSTTRLQAYSKATYGTQDGTNGSGWDFSTTTYKLFGDVKEVSEETDANHNWGPYFSPRGGYGKRLVCTSLGYYEEIGDASSATYLCDKVDNITTLRTGDDLYSDARYELLGVYGHPYNTGLNTKNGIGVTYRTTASDTDNLTCAILGYC